MTFARMKRPYPLPPRRRGGWGGGGLGRLTISAITYEKWYNCSLIKD
jgi:hypothetical protein